MNCLKDLYRGMSFLPVKSISDKTMKNGRPGSQEDCKSQEVRKGQRRLPGLKKPEPQESGRLRLADHKSQESGE